MVYAAFRVFQEVPLLLDKHLTNKRLNRSKDILIINSSNRFSIGNALLYYCLLNRYLVALMLSRLALIFSIILLSSNVSIAVASNITQAQPSSIILAPGDIKISLEQSIQWLKADHFSLSLSQLQSSSDAVFNPLNKGAILESNQVYWLRMRVINSFDKNIPLALSLAPKNVIIESGYKQSDGKWTHLTQVSPNTLLTGQSSLILTFDSLSDNWIYFRVKAPSTTKLNAKLQDLTHYTKDLNFYQQLLGASIATTFIIILLHLLALQFHNHIRHYLAIFMAIVVSIFISNHSPTPFLPEWVMVISTLTPWSMACALALSSYKTEFYRINLFSNQSFFVTLLLIFIGLVLITANYSIILAVSLALTIYSAFKAIKVSHHLFLACCVFIIVGSWQLLYLLNTSYIYSPSDMHEVYGFVFTAVLVSTSMITPYFRRQTSRQAPVAQNNYSSFLSKLSHDFRTPMNGVLGMSELLKDTPLSQQQRSFLSTIEQSGHDLLRLINRVSDMGKIQTGKLQSDNQVFDLVNLIEKLIEKHIPLADQNHVEMILNIAPNISTDIKCDEDRLNAVLDNVILNALTKTNNGEVEIRVHWVDDASQNQLLFTVRDSGSGIPRETLKKILSSHKQITNAEMEIQNIDFGLLLSKYVVEALQGAFYIESNPNIGTTIRFSMLVEPIQNQQPTHDSSILNGLSMLIVDDNSTFRSVIKQYAESWGAHADATYNGKEALALLRNHKTIENPYDIMLIDQEMPIMSGFQLASKIQDDPDINQDIIKIMLTGTGITSQDSLALDAGIHQVVTKPVSARTLQAVLAKHMSRRNLSK